MSRTIYLLAAMSVLGCCLCLPQQTVNGPRPPSSAANATLDHLRHFNNGTNGTRDTGICYIEVPTASIAKDPNNIPAGNGSTTALSRVPTCCAGYRRHPHIFRRCEPVCSSGCVHGVCSAPETCTCDAGHVLNLGGVCVPTCPTSCQDGRCAPEGCVCNAGFVLEPQRQFCVPQCRDDCGGHGNCTAPNTCDCPKEFPLGEGGICQAMCPGCQHGDCLGPNQCRCHKGYAKDQQGECSPVCSRGCENGICVAPETCACQYGYKFDEVLNACQPKCLTPCYNSLCTGPDTCTCKQGYIKDENNPLGNVCQPHCPSGCPNGVCTNPNYCICNYGFVKDKSSKSQNCVKSRQTRSLPVF